LRVVVLTLALFSGLLTICTVRLALKEPLIVERDCSASRILKTADTKRSVQEIEQFVRFALPKRFDTEVQDFKLFLSDEESAYRAKEQDELAKKGMVQRVLVNSIKMEGSTITVDADRMISVGKIKSVLPFPLTVFLSSMDRSELNPYGLVIQRVSPVTETDSSKQ
jgi:hypothetical protein